MRKQMTALAAVFVFTACDGNPFITPAATDNTSTVTFPAGTSGQTDFTSQADLTLNAVTYDATTDTLNLNNLPFDDPNNDYTRIAGSSLAGGFGAYESNPAAGTGEFEYFAVFRRSASGETQVVGAATTEYVGNGYGGAIVQRLGDGPSLPTSGIFTFTGEYGAVRTSTIDAGNDINFITGDAVFVLDLDDFDNTGAIAGGVGNRVLYDVNGTSLGAYAGSIIFEDSVVNFADASVTPAQVFENVPVPRVDAMGNPVIDPDTGLQFIDNEQRGSGQWTGLLAGPNGEELTGILFVEDAATYREVGTFVTTR